MKNNQKYIVFNHTDGIFASPDQMTKKEAEKFVREFPLGYKNQGYYRTSKREMINPEDVKLEIRPLIIRSRDKAIDKGKEM